MREVYFILGIFNREIFCSDPEILVIQSDGLPAPW